MNITCRTIFRAIFIQAAMNTTCRRAGLIYHLQLAVEHENSTQLLSADITKKRDTEFVLDHHRSVASVIGNKAALASLVRAARVVC